jgi:hypothetical protein
MVLGGFRQSQSTETTNQGEYLMSEKTESTPRAWLAVSTEFLVNALELPPGVEILGVRFLDNNGRTTVELLVEDVRIPQGAHQVEAHYKPKFDRFRQTDPVLEDEGDEKMVLKAGQRPKSQCRCPCTCGHSHDPKKTGTCKWCVAARERLKAESDGATH